MAKRTFVDQIEICTCDTRQEMGLAAAKDFAACVERLLETKLTIRVIFAAAPSQNEFLEAIANDPAIDFSRVDAFHMDEYIGLAPDAPQGFGNFLRRAIFDRRVFHSVNYLRADANVQAKCEEYAQKLTSAPVDVVCMGIGENGHIAFNDPHAADFHDPKLVKVVELDRTCRIQQVHDGCFSTIDEVPTHAITLTIPALAAARHHFCMVPTAHKAEAVKRTVEGSIGEACPATVLRRLQGSVLYLDADSAALLA